jgi:hypothetical protein
MAGKASIVEAKSLTRRVFLRRASVVTFAVAAGGLLAPRTSVAAEPAADDIVHIQGAFLLGTGSEGIDPATQPVALRLLVPPGERVYPSGTDFMPMAGFVPTADGWALSSAEKTRTGLQAFDIKRTDQPAGFMFNFVDTRTSLAARNYGVVWVVLTIGDDTGEADEALVEKNGTWTLS